MKNQIKKIFYALVIGMFLSFSFAVFAVSDSANIGLEITSEGVCNNNGSCDTGSGETASNCPGDCPSPRVGGPGTSEILELYIKDISVEKIALDSAQISWQTTKLASCSLYLGLTLDYETEIISETSYKTLHSVNLKNLLIGAVYHFKITCLGSPDLETESQDAQFKTKNVLENPKNFKAEPGDGKIFLSWGNPTEENFKEIRIVRNSNFYPSDPEDGILIYRGILEKFTDEGLQNNKEYYYTIFSTGKENDFSSGSAASAIPLLQELEKKPEKKEPAVIIAQVLEKISIFDFDFYSAGRKINIESEPVISVEAGSSLVASINSEKIPAFYQRIMISLDIENDRFAYLFGQNEEKTLFVSEMRIPQIPGSHPMQIIFFDSLGNVVKKIDFRLKIYKRIKVFGGWMLPEEIFIKAIILLVLAILAGIIFIIIRRAKRATP